MADEIDMLLDAYHASTLWEIAQAAGLEVTGPGGKRLPKAKVQALMRAEFFTRERVLASLQRLDKWERILLDRLLLRGGATPTRSLRRELLQAGVVTIREESRDRGHHYHSVPYVEGYAGSPRRPSSTEFVDVVARLTYHGLVFSKDALLSSGSAPYKLQYHPGSTLYVPEKIQRYLPKPEPIPVQVRDWQPAHVRSGDPALLMRDLYLYWDFVRRNEVSLLQSGFVGRRSLKAINKVLLLPDPALEDARREVDTSRLYLLRLLLEKLDLVRRRRGQLRLASEDALHIPPFWGWSLPRQLMVCLEAWSSLGATTGQEEDAHQYNPRFAHARQVVLAVLQALPRKAWFELEELQEKIQDRDLDFLFADHSKIMDYRTGWYYSYSGTYYGSTKELRRNLELLERSFVQGCVIGFLPQLGLVDVGHVGGQWHAFRLTPTGQVLLDAKDEQHLDRLPQEGEGRLIVQPNFQVMAIGPVNLEWLARLDLFAQRERADRGAFEYRISRDSIYRAQQAGMEVSEVLLFLTDVGGVEIAQNVRRSLEEWGAHHERIVFRTNVSLLQAADTSLLSELMDAPRIGEHLARSVSPEVALLKNGRQEPLVSDLLVQGLFPAVSGARPESADHSVIIHADGTIHPIHTVPSLHLRGRLARLAEELPDGSWQLSAQLVRRASGTKTKMLRLLEELAKLHRGEFPQELVEQLKAWGGYYGNAAVETLTLIEFRDQDILAELETHPSLQPYLSPFPAGNRALAVVPRDKLAEVHDILTSLGVRLREGTIS
jgi:hypothetical protein